MSAIAIPERSFTKSPALRVVEAVRYSSKSGSFTKGREEWNRRQIRLAARRAVRNTDVEIIRALKNQVKYQREQTEQRLLAIA